MITLDNNDLIICGGLKMWKKNKHRGLYDDFTELDKNTPVSKNTTEKNMLTDRIGFYNRNVVKNNNINNDFQQKYNKINSNNSNDDVKNVNFKNNNTMVKINIIDINNRLNDLEKKITTLNENIAILNRNLNIAKDKINENFLLRSEEMLNVTHFTARKMIEGNENYKYNNNHINENQQSYKDISDIINNARKKNILLKNNNLSDDRYLENNIKNKSSNRQQNFYEHLKNNINNNN